MPPPSPTSSIAVSATFTADPLEESLGFWMRQLGLDLEVRFASYNQVFQQLLDPGSLFAINRNGINIVLVRFEDWQRYHEGGRKADLEENARHLISVVRTAVETMASPLIVGVCPSTGECALEEMVRAGLRGLRAVHLIGPNEVAALYPIAEVHDPHANELGHVPYTPEYFVALGTMLARKARAIRSAPYKAIALDCDNTLWSGICGEDGPQGVEIDPPRRALQEFMAAQQASGMLLCLCSKNNEEDVIETFRAHPDMPLKLEHFVARRINWDAKAVNLESLGAELDLALDTFILVDDNPKECDEVRANCPDVTALALPEQTDEIPAFLSHVWAFDRATVTEEDRRRTAMYAQQAERAKLQRSSASLDEFLASLKLEIGIAAATEDQYPRIAQLTQRTNQMNFTLVRRSEVEFRILSCECLAVDVRDRFGGYGLTGVIVFEAAGDALKIDTFLASCRVLGRGVEHRMLARLGEIAVERGLEWIEAPFVRGQRNRPALLFLESVGAPFRSGDTFRLPAAHAAAIVYKPSRTAAPAAFPALREPVERTAVDFAHIASEFREPAAILAHIRGANHRPAAARARYAAPRTVLERELSELWAGLLGVPRVGVEDNFFDLGGHSLLAVHLLSRVRQAYGVDLSLEIVYSGNFTVAELAKGIETSEIEHAGAGEYAALVAELEGLSEEEVRALLAEEDR